MHTYPKASPGPWLVQVDPCHYHTRSDVSAKDGMFISVGGQTTTETQEANTRLVAAAPQLYHFCKAIQRACEHCIKHDDFLDLDDISSSIDHLLSAIENTK